MDELIMAAGVGLLAIMTVLLGVLVTVDIRTARRDRKRGTGLDYYGEEGKRE